LKAANPYANYVRHKDEIDRAIQRVLISGHYILGPYADIFEDSFGRYIGGQCIGVGCGTDALALSMQALGIGTGHEVVIGAYVPLAVVAAILMVGATPVIVDVKEEDLTIDPSKVAIHPGLTKAILAVHIFGNACDLTSLRDLANEKGVALIEDISQATGGSYKGRRLGSFGDITACSFYPTKPLGAIGDGGAVITKDIALAERARMLRQYGWEDGRISNNLTGRCSRLDELQAAILSVKLDHLDADNAHRIAIAEFYREIGLQDYHGETSVYHQYVIRDWWRDNLKYALEQMGIFTNIHYRVLPWENAAYRPRCITHACPVAQEASNTALSLPLWAEMTGRQVARVRREVEQWMSL
jgi:dTDP-4-amino-4,6-dideoxygalactose transaminase